MDKQLHWLHMVLAVGVPLSPDQKRSPFSHYVVMGGQAYHHCQAVHIHVADSSLFGNRLRHVGLDGDLQHLGLTKVAAVTASDLSQWCSDYFSSGSLC